MTRIIWGFLTTLITLCSSALEFLPDTRPVERSVESTASHWFEYEFSIETPFADLGGKIVIG